MKLGIHDLLPLSDGETTQERYQRTVEMVQALETIGYDRYWASEHHGARHLASSAPEIFLAYLASRTNKIRLGTGGTMIVNYSPLRVAEIFKTLTLLAPDRIDLGIGRAPGTDHHGMLALSQGNPVNFDYLFDKAQVILDYLRDQEPAGFYSLVKAIPAETETLAQPWMLGSTGNSALKAGEMGLGYSFAKFFGIEIGPEVFQTYRDHFKPSPFFDQPQVMASYLIILADTPEEADRLARPMEISSISDHKQALRTLDQAQDYTFSPEEEALLREKYDRRFLIKGTPATVKLILRDEIDRYGIDELMAYMPIPDQEARIHSYDLLYQIFH